MQMRLKKSVIWILAAVIMLTAITGCKAQKRTEFPTKAYEVQEIESQKNETQKAETSGKEEEVPAEQPQNSEKKEQLRTDIREEGSYTSKEEVSLYLHLYGHLPDNYITKNRAQDLGWDSKEGNLDQVAPGKSIGGSRFGNYEGLLPEEKGRKYYECDLDYEGGYRGAKRLIYSSDGLIFYTEDHYKTFEQLY